MKKLLVTGGDGFIARNIYEQLSNKYNIISVNRQKLDLLDSSKVADYIKRNKFDVAIHTATYDAAPYHSTKDPTKVLENNMKMFNNIVECKEYFDKMIYFGSGAEFDREHWIPKMKEDYLGKHVPTDQYGLSKYKMTEYTLKNEKIFNLRLFAVFGKYDDWRVRIISSICKDVALGNTVSINQNKSYDLTDIDDVIRVLDWAISNNPKEKVYNVCSGKIIDFKTIAEKVIKISGKRLDIKIKKEGLGQEYSGDNTLLMKEMKDFKFTPFDESIRKLYLWFEKNKKDFLIKV